MSISDASTQVFGSKKAVAFFQSLLIVLALGAWVLPERAFSQEVTVELADTASVPGGIAVVPFIFTGMEISAEFTGQVQFSEPPLSIRTLDLCVPDDPGSIACEEFDSGSISIFIDPDSGLLPNFTGYLIFNVDSDADLGATPVGWSQTDAEPFTVIEFDGVVSILSSAELQVSALPSFVDFGEVEVFTDDFLGVEICGTNDQEGPVWIVDAQADNENFFVEPDGGTCPSEFPFDISGESGGCCIMEVRFSPDGETEFSSQLEIFSSVGQSVIPLSGEGIPEGDFLPVLLPESHDFGSLPANTPAFHDFVLTNEGSQTGAIDALFISGDEEFSIASQDCIPFSPPGTLNPGEQCTILVEFLVTDTAPEPQSFSGDLVVETSAGNLNSALTGIAQSPDELFADFFDNGGGSCSIGNWSTFAGLSDADAGSPDDGNRRYSRVCGLKVPVDETVRYVEDQSPIAETTYKARFYAFFDDIESGAVEFFKAFGDGIARLQLVYEDGGIRFSTFNDEDFEVFEDIPDIGAGWHSIDLSWESGANAEARLSLNGTEDIVIQVNNPSHRIDEVRLGNLMPDLSGEGSIDFDGFDSRRFTRAGRLLVGDANDDGEIDFFDLAILDGELEGGSFAPGQADCNEDGVVDVEDINCIGGIIADGALLEFALDDIDAEPGEDIELPAWLSENPTGATWLNVRVEIDNALLSFRTDGPISCGALSAGENLGGLHDLGCKEMGDDLSVTVSGSTPLPVGELFRVRLSVDPSAEDGDLAFAGIADLPEIYREETEPFPIFVRLPPTMYLLTDGSVFVREDDADLILDPPSRDFGFKATRTTRTQVFEVRNNGTETGEINDFFITGDADEFTIVSSTCLNGSPPNFLSPGDSCNITVQFFVDAILIDPTDFAAELVVETGDGDLIASLSGTAQTFDPIFSDRFDVEFLPMPRGLSFMMPRGGGTPPMLGCGLFNWNVSVGLFNSDTGNPGADNRRYSGPCGLRVPLDGAVRLVGDLSPILETQYLATFYAFFDDVTDGAVMFFEAAGAEQARVQLVYADGGIIFSVFDNDGNEISEVIPDIGSGWHSFSLIWQASSNAEIALSISGAEDVVLEVDNSSHRIEEVYLGNLEPDLGGAGSIDLDAFDSRRLTRPGRLLAGDANDDGVIDIADLRAVDREISPSLQLFAHGQPDCNEDGVVDDQDLECIGAIIVGDQPFDFALDEVTALPGESIELAGLLNDDPFDAISISVVISIDTDILSFGTDGISCGRVVRGEALTDQHTLICGTSGDAITTVSVVGTASTLPDGELFRLLLDINPDASLGEEFAVVIDDVEIDLSGLLMPSTMYVLSDGLVRTPDPEANLVLDPPNHDFGVIEPGTFPVSRGFTLTNTGDPGSLAEITSVNLVGNSAFELQTGKGDSCTGRTLAAGEDCMVFVLFDAEDLLPGKYATVLEFDATPPVTPAPIVGIRDGIVEFDILPGNIDFGTVTVGDGPVFQTLELVSIGDVPLDLAEVSFSIGGSMAFEITDNACNPSLSLNPGESCAIELAFFGGDQAPGSYTGFFQASSDSSSVTVNLFGETEAAPPEAALSVNPTARNFGQLGIADFPVTQLFTVTNSGEPGSVASISNAALTGSPLFSLTSNNCPGAALAAGQSCTFTVSFDASDAPPNTYAASVQIVSDAGNPAVSLSGTRVPSEINLSVNPLSHDFGSLSADDLPATQRFTVLASGDPGLDIAITGVALSEDDAFAVTEDNCSGAELSNTQTCLVEVSFNPSALAPGNYTATLEIVSDESLLIPLSGQLAVTAPQPDIFVLPAPTNQRPGVASFVGELSSSGVGNAVAAAGRIGPAATTRFLVSAPAEGAVYLIADGNFNAPARGIDSDPDATIRFQVSGPTPFGISQAGDGDFRASGHSTIALGDSLAGRVVLLFGSADTPPGATAIDLTEVTGSGAELDAGFETIVISGSDLMTQGFELAFIGDFNGNGHDDLAIGLPDYGSAGQGRVYVVFGNASDDNVNLDALEPDQGIIIDGTTTDGALGFSVAGAGDFNGSGFADLVIGAPFSSDYGRVVVVFGNDEPASLSVSALDGSNGFIARMPVESSAGPRFGYSVAGAGDFDGDGFNDIIVGAPRSMLLDQPSLPGQARILFGQASVESGTVLIDDHDRLRQLAINPFSIGNNSMFGFSVAGLGDSSRNGFSDVAIGDPGYGDPVNNPALPRFTGQAYAVFGRTDPPTSLIAEELESDQASVYRPQQPSVRAGWAVAGIGDFSGDGFPDLLVTGPGASTSGLSNAGQIWAVGGRETAVVIDPEIDAIDPATGLVTGGETVTIFGRHFLEGVEVWFGEQPCLEVERIDHSQLRCLTPPTGASITDVSVINPDGTGVTLEEAFRFLDPTSLEVTAASFPGQFGQTGRLAEFEVFNSGDFAAEQLTLTISTNGADILDWFSLAPQCTVEGQVAICDFSEVAPWQCSISDNQATCMLGLLPAEGRAAVMLDFSGSGPVPTSLNLSSINADSIATNAELFGDN